MSREPGRTAQMTRRRFLVNAAITMTNPSQILDSSGLLVAQWHLHNVATGAFDSVRNITDPVNARAAYWEWPAGPTGRALRLDGYSNWITRHAASAPILTNSFTVEMWVALETYPVTDAPFINQHVGPSAGWFFGLNNVGRWGLSLSAGGNWQECFAPDPFPKNGWVHIAATFDSHTGMSVHLNGVLQHKVAFSTPLPLLTATHADLVIGRHNLTPYTDSGVFPTGVLNGIVAEVGIYNAALTSAQILAHYRQPGRVGAPDFAIPSQRFAHDVHRPTYHAMPDAAWTNEPHGILLWNDKYHIFFQQNANGPYWGQIHWGHLESSDLVAWQPQLPVLAPEVGNDQVGCWSGTALEFKGVPSILYTGVNGAKASICLAQSTGDLTSWTKYKNNPVISGTPPGLNLLDFRDPYAWVEGDTVYAIIGTGIQNQGGAVLLFRSHDLVNWTFVKILFSGQQAESGTFWEMPFLIPIGEKHLLMVCEMPGRSSYWIGTWQNETFTPDYASPKHLEVINHFLSPTPYIDKQGHITVIGISPDLRSPHEAWKAGWRHVYGVPRELTLGPDGETLVQKPIVALQKLRGAHFQWVNVPLSNQKGDFIPAISGDTLEIVAVFNVTRATHVGIRFRCSPDRLEETLLTYDLPAQQITIDRSRSSTNPAVDRGINTGPLVSKPGDLIEMHLFLDRSMIDVFLNGRDAFTTRIYPTRPDSIQIAFFCTGNATLKTLDVWRMNPAQP